MDLIGRRLLGPRQKTQAEMNVFFQGALWNLAERYTDMVGYARWGALPQQLDVFLPCMVICRRSILTCLSCVPTALFLETTMTLRLRCRSPIITVAIGITCMSVRRQPKLVFLVGQSRERSLVSALLPEPLADSAIEMRQNNPNRSGNQGASLLLTFCLCSWATSRACATHALLAAILMLAQADQDSVRGTFLLGHRPGGSLRHVSDYVNAVLGGQIFVVEAVEEAAGERITRVNFFFNAYSSKFCLFGADLLFLQYIFLKLSIQWSVSLFGTCFFIIPNF